MSTCDTCRRPGSCCTGLVLSVWFDRVEWKREAADFTAARNIPYMVPVRPLATTLDDPSGQVAVMFDCTRLDANGRCGDYENRPDVCRTYEPGIDKLCAEYVHRLSGIPIVTVRP